MCGGYSGIGTHSHYRLNSKLVDIKNKKNNNIILKKLLLRECEGGTRCMGDMPGVIGIKNKRSG